MKTSANNVGHEKNCQKFLWRWFFQGFCQPRKMYLSGVKTADNTKKEIPDKISYFCSAFRSPIMSYPMLSRVCVFGGRRIERKCLTKGFLVLFSYGFFPKKWYFFLKKKSHEWRQLKHKHGFWSLIPHTMITQHIPLIQA